MRNIVKKQSGITLIALVVTIIVLIILAGVSINMLVGENGIINMAQRAKEDTQQAANEEQHSLTGVFESNYVTYNGQLHVEGTKLMNENNEEVRLKGCVLANSDDGKFTKTILSNLKNKWNNNVIKVGLNNTSSGQSNIINESNMQEMYQIIDDAIDLDMYVIVIFWSGNDLTEDIYNQANEYFMQIASRYKNIPNLIYEIANEPACEWSEIKEYANTVIPTIRNISPNSLILCPTKGHNSVKDVIHSELEYKNIMYVAHVYEGNIDDRRLVSTAVLNNIPIFISEWSNTLDYSTAENEETDKFVALMDKYNLSSTFFILDEVNREGSIALVEQNMWDETLNDNTLTEAGLYAKEFFKGTYEKYQYSIEDYTMATTNMHYENFFWNSTYRSKITKIITKDSINIPENAVEVWDISSTASGNVIAYIVNDNTENGTYIAYIEGNGKKVYACNIGRLFRGFDILESIDLSYLDCSNVTDMYEWFSAESTLNSIIGLNTINALNVTDIRNLFANCTSLNEIDLTSFDFSKVVDNSGMLEGLNSNINIYCKNIEDAAYIYNIRNLNNINYYDAAGNLVKYTL